MAIKQIGILSSVNGAFSWVSYDLGADANNIVLTNVNSDPSISNETNFASVITLSTNTGTQAWNNFNKLCKLTSSKINNLSTAITNLNTSVNTSINTILPVQKNLTLNSASWTNNLTYTISNDAFFASTGYVYWVSPVGANYEGVYADNITTANTITLHCLTKPAENVIINVIKMKSGTFS